MPLTELWSREAALTACCTMVRACVPELPYANVYQGDLDLTKLRPSCRVYQVSEPIERAWMDERRLSAQAQSWLVTVGAVIPGDVYATTVLQSAAPYEALVGDDSTAIRDNEIIQLTALGKPITISAVSDNQLRITGVTPGQHLGVSVSNNLTLELEADDLHDQGLMPSWWTARFEFEEPPGVDGSASRAPAWATRLRGYMQAGLADDVLRAAHLDFNTIVLRTNFTRPDRGKTTVVEILDVQFTAIQGLGFDVPSLQSFGTAPTTKVQP